MINSSPISSPPPNLRKLWAQQAQRLTPHDINGWLDYVANQAAQWGANQELEACCEWIATYPWLEHPKLLIKQLRAARRPKPPTLKEQALALVSHDFLNQPCLSEEGYALIRRALEALPND